MNIKEKDYRIRFHEECFVYKNLEKHDEDVVEFDIHFMHMSTRYKSYLQCINIYKSTYERTDKDVLSYGCDNLKVEIKTELKYIDILLCGDKDSGKTTFLHCITGVNRTNKNSLKDTEKIIYNSNQLQLFSYIPIILSKLTNRNYDEFRKVFKKNFIDTDICEASVFITREDLLFMFHELFGSDYNINRNHEDVTIFEDLSKTHFDYVKINFCEYGQDLLDKIKNCYDSFFRTWKYYSGGIQKNLCWNIVDLIKNDNIDVLSLYKIRNIIETALMRIRQTKHINYFINLMRTFQFISENSYKYRWMLISQNGGKKEEIENKIKRKWERIEFIWKMRIGLSLFLNRSIIRRKPFRQRKKNVYITIDENHLFSMFQNLYIINDATNFDVKDIIYFCTRLLDYEKMSYRFRILFDVNQNVAIFNRVLHKNKQNTNKHCVQKEVVGHILEKFVNLHWIRVEQKGKKRRMIFKYVLKRKTEGEGKFRQSVLHSFEEKLDIETKEINKKLMDLFSNEAINIRACFRAFYNEYIYKNKCRKYIKYLIKEQYDICVVFMKICFYYLQFFPFFSHLNKLLIRNFFYLKQIEISKKKESSCVHYDICVPSCVFAFANLLKINYGSESIACGYAYEQFLLKYVLGSVAYLKWKRNSLDIRLLRKKNQYNRVCYFTRNEIINGIIELYELNANFVIPSEENEVIDKAIERNKKILQQVFQSIDINIPLYIIVDHIKKKWKILSKRMVRSNICSYFKERNFIYPNICLEISIPTSYSVMKKTDGNALEKPNEEDTPTLVNKIKKNVCEESKMQNAENEDEDEKGYSRILILTPRKHYVDINKKRRKRNSILHFPFHHKVLQYFYYELCLENKKDHNILNWLCKHFLHVLGKFFDSYQNGSSKIELAFMFIFFNCLMDIYYLMSHDDLFAFVYEEGKCMIKQGKYVNKRKSKENKDKTERNKINTEGKKKISISLSKCNLLCSQIDTFCKELKDKKKEKSKKTYIRYLKKNLFVSVLTKQ